MAWKIHLKGEPKKVIYDQIRINANGWVNCWNTDEDGYDLKELTKYPSWRITKIERVVG